MNRIEISSLQVGGEIGINAYHFQPSNIVKIVRITKTMIELDNGQKWRSSQYSGWKCADDSFGLYILITAEDARARNARLADEHRHQQKVSRIESVEFKHLPEATLDALIAVMDAYRQDEADAALAKFLTTGEKY